MPWLTLGKFALAHWQGIAIAGLLAFLWIQGQRIDNLKEQAGGYERSIKAYERAAQRNEAELHRCEQVNADNAREAERQRQNALEAVRQLRQLQNQSNQDIEDIDREASQIRDSVDTSCAALDDPDVLDWVCSGPGGCN